MNTTKNTSNSSNSLDKLLGLLSEKLTLADVLSAKLLAQISGKIAEKRLELNMNQTEFAQYMGVTQGMISKWECSDYNFTIKTLAKIAEKLNLNLDLTFDNNVSKNQITVYQSNDYVFAECSCGSYISDVPIQKANKDTAYKSFIDSWKTRINDIIFDNTVFDSTVFNNINILVEK